MNTRLHPTKPRTAAAFTLAEMLIVVTIIGLLAALTLQGYTYAMRASKWRVTEATITAIQSSLERYSDKFGEYPEPAMPNETLEVIPGRVYDVSGARCLYQALRGDGYDAILGGENGGGENGASDGNFQDDEIEAVMFKDMPPAMWRSVSGNYIVIDGFSMPFQYVKAISDPAEDPVTINPTYDLWSYAEDETNTSAKSIDTQDSPQLSQKWIKNWN